MAVGRCRVTEDQILCPLVSPNAGADLAAVVELTVFETERVGGTVKRIECPLEDPSAPKEVRARPAQSVITHTNQTAIIDSAAANWTRTAVTKPVIVARVARHAATVSPVRRRSPT
jgi:hypothetical protein